MHPANTPSISLLGLPTPCDTLIAPLGLCVGANNQAMIANDCGRVMGSILYFDYGFYVCVVVVCLFVIPYKSLKIAPNYCALAKHRRLFIMPTWCAQD